MPLDVITLTDAGTSSQNKHRWRELQRLTWESGRTVGDFIFQNAGKLFVKFRIRKAWLHPCPQLTQNCSLCRLQNCRKFIAEFQKINWILKLWRICVVFICKTIRF